MEKEKVYLDSSIPSYRVSESSKDELILIRQKITIEWWDKNRENYDLYISDVVLDEIERGDLKYAEKRLELLKGITNLEGKPEVEETVLKYMEFFNLPEKLYRDMTHIAYAVHYEMDCLLTWNFTHLANLHMKTQLARLNERLGFRTPVICTPEELMENSEGGSLL